jgi:hypothetical protein
MHNQTERMKTTPQRHAVALGIVSLLFCAAAGANAALRVWARVTDLAMNCLPRAYGSRAGRKQRCVFRFLPGQKLVLHNRPQPRVSAGGWRDQRGGRAAIPLRLFSTHISLRKMKKPKTETPNAKSENRLRPAQSVLEHGRPLSIFTFSLIIAAVGWMAFGVFTALAATSTWTGAGVDNRWMTADNWAGNIAPTPGNDLFFPPGAMKNLNDNDFPAGTTFNSMIFSGLAYSISGNSIALNAGIVATNGSSSSINNSLILNSNQTFFLHVVNNSFLFPPSSAIDLNGKELSFDLGFGVTAQVQARITGAGVLSKAGSAAGALNLYASNSFSGLVQILQGNLNMYHSNALGDASQSVMIAEAGTLRLLNVITLSKPLVLAGKLSSSGGGIKILNGPISLTASNASIEAGLGAPLTINGLISGNGGFTAGSGGEAVTLNSDNTYSGATTLFGQILRVNGWQPISPILLSAGTLGGTGTVGTVTTTGAFSKAIAPGGSAAPGILNSSNVTLSPSTTFTVRLNGPTAGSAHDQLNVNGSVALGNAALSVTLGFTPASSTAFKIVNNDGADGINGTFSGLPEGATVNAGAHPLTISYVGGDGNDVVLYFGAPPARLTGIHALPGGAKEVRGLGISNLTYTIQAATNLTPAIVWSNLGTALADGSGNISFTDTNAPLFPIRFYRALSP